MNGAFFDTGILIYALGNDRKGLLARDLYQRGGRVSVQCLTEFASVARRHLKLSWNETEEALADMRQRCGHVIVLDEAVHRDGLRLARHYRLSIHDGMIAAAAITADCAILYSEHMPHSLLIDRRLRIVNPFLPNEA